MSKSTLKPKYPIYIPSKGRSHVHKTTRELNRDGVPFFLVVEPQEVDDYKGKVGCTVLTLPKGNQGLVYARNWIKDHATASGAARHWQIDDNIFAFKRWHNKGRRRCSSAIALGAVEHFVDRYENVAVAGLNYEMFLAKRPIP